MQASIGLAEHLTELQRSCTAAWGEEGAPVAPGPVLQELRSVRAELSCERSPHRGLGHRRRPTLTRRGAGTWTRT